MPITFATSNPEPDTMRTRPIDYLFAIAFGLAIGALIALGI
jgi:hypothetical protein